MFRIRDDRLVSTWYVPEDEECAAGLGEGQGHQTDSCNGREANGSNDHAADLWGHEGPEQEEEEDIEEDEVDREMDEEWEGWLDYSDENVLGEDYDEDGTDDGGPADDYGDDEDYDDD